MRLAVGFLTLCLSCWGYYDIQAGLADFTDGVLIAFRFAWPKTCIEEAQKLLDVSKGTRLRAESLEEVFR